MAHRNNFYVFKTIFFSISIEIFCYHHSLLKEAISKLKIVNFSIIAVLCQILNLCSFDSEIVCQAITVVTDAHLWFFGRTLRWVSLLKDIGVILLMVKGRKFILQQYRYQHEEDCCYVIIRTVNRFLKQIYHGIELVHLCLMQCSATARFVVVVNFGGVSEAYECDLSIIDHHILKLNIIICIARRMNKLYNLKQLAAYVQNCVQSMPVSVLL